MEAKRHPYFEEEKDRLEKTINAIDDFVEGKLLVNPVGGDAWATANLERINAQLKELYLHERGSPYYARVDFQEDGEQSSKLYFGYRSLNLGRWEVIEWRAPIGRLLSAPKAVKLAIPVPGGRVSGVLLLRRKFKIHNCTLTDISDEFNQDKSTAANETKTNEEFLIEELYSRGDPRLKDIVKTIQHQQDEIIRAPHDRVVIINGVAGSGKTSIAIHRLAYLLFPDNQTNIKASRSIIFCPSRIFLGYIKDLLPTLGENDVIQTTFSDWAMGRMLFKKKYKVVDYLQGIFIASLVDRNELVSLWRNAQLKGELRFRKILENYVSLLRKSIKTPEKNWIYSDLGELNLTLVINKNKVDELLTILNEGESPLGSQRETVLISLRKELEKSFDEAVWKIVENLKQRSENLQKLALMQKSLIKQKSLLDESSEKLKESKQFQSRAFGIPTTKKNTIGSAIKLMNKDFEALWPEIDIVNKYYELFTNLDLLNHVAKRDLTQYEINALHKSTQNPGIINLEDIPALYYFYRLIRDEVRESYDHIVVDEAQDFSPLQFSILQEFSRDDSMTIVGDISQGIQSFRGISDWKEITPIFKPKNTQREDITKSYRSTKEIVKFTNAILVNIHKKNAILAEPFNRSGEKPILYKTQLHSIDMQSIVNEVKRLHGRYQHIAVLVKTDDECRNIYRYFREQNINASYSTSDDKKDYIYFGGIVILPITLSKGIEFEAVVIADASEKEFNQTKKYDGWMLYVAITRALHHLSIFYYGKVSGFLSGTEQLTTHGRFDDSPPSGPVKRKIIIRSSNKKVT